MRNSASAIDGGMVEDDRGAQRQAERRLQPVLQLERRQRVHADIEEARARVSTGSRGRPAEHGRDLLLHERRRPRAAPLRAWRAPRARARARSRRRRRLRAPARPTPFEERPPPARFEQLLEDRPVDVGDHPEAGAPAPGAPSDRGRIVRMRATPMPMRASSRRPSTIHHAAFRPGSPVDRHHRQAAARGGRRRARRGNGSPRRRAAARAIPRRRRSTRTRRRNRAAGRRVTLVQRARRRPPSAPGSRRSGSKRYRANGCSPARPPDGRCRAAAVPAAAIAAKSASIAALPASALEHGDVAPCAWRLRTPAMRSRPRLEVAGAGPTPLPAAARAARSAPDRAAPCRTIQCATWRPSPPTPPVIR